MNKVKKVLMTMFGLLMFPLLFACNNTQSQGVEIGGGTKSRVCSI